MTLPTLDDELPVAHVPNVKDWSENFCFVCYDAVRDIGFWLHIGRWAYDPELWREQILLFMPGGSFLTRRSHGLGRAAKGPAGACFEIVTEKPGDSFRLLYRGPVRQISERELANAPLPEAPLILLNLDVRFTANTSVVWDFGVAAKGEIWAHSHYEQPGRLFGTISYKEAPNSQTRIVEVDTLGYRDHSRGPRNLETMQGHCWIQAHFQDRSFAIFDVFLRDQNGVPTSGFSQARIFTRDRSYEAAVETLPRLSSTAEPPKSYDLTFHSQLGTDHVHASIARTLTHSVSPYMDGFDGHTPGLAAVGAFQQPSLFDWNGTSGVGYTERTARFDQSRASS